MTADVLVISVELCIYSVGDMVLSWEYTVQEFNMLCNAAMSIQALAKYVSKMYLSPFYGSLCFGLLLFRGDPISGLLRKRLIQSMILCKKYNNNTQYKIVHVVHI